MSKFEPLWKWIEKNGAQCVQLSFAEIESIVGLPIDHSFLQYKKELSAYGYRVEKIAMLAKAVTFERLQ